MPNLPLPLADPDDEEFLKCIANGGGFPKAWSGNVAVGHTNGWEKFLPYKQQIIDGDSKYFVDLASRITVLSKHLAAEKWEYLVENYISKRPAIKQVFVAGKVFRLRASNIKFMIRPELSTSKSDHINIQYLGNKDIVIEILSSELDKIAEEIK